MENAGVVSMIRAGLYQGDVSVADEVCAASFIENDTLVRTDLPGPDILKTKFGRLARK